MKLGKDPSGVRSAPPKSVNGAAAGGRSHFLDEDELKGLRQRLDLWVQQGGGSQKEADRLFDKAKINKALGATTAHDGPLPDLGGSRFQVKRALLPETKAALPSSSASESMAFGQPREATSRGTPLPLTPAGADTIAASSAVMDADLGSGAVDWRKLDLILKGWVSSLPQEVQSEAAGQCVAVVRLAAGGAKEAEIELPGKLTPPRLTGFTVRIVGPGQSSRQPEKSLDPPAQTISDFLDRAPAEKAAALLSTWKASRKPLRADAEKEIELLHQLMEAHYQAYGYGDSPMLADMLKVGQRAFKLLVRKYAVVPGTTPSKVKFERSDDWPHKLFVSVQGADLRPEGVIPVKSVMAAMGLWKTRKEKLHWIYTIDPSGLRNELSTSAQVSDLAAWQLMALDKIPRPGRTAAQGEMEHEQWAHLTQPALGGGPPRTAIQEFLRSDDVGLRLIEFRELVHLDWVGASHVAAKEYVKLLRFLEPMPNDAAAAARFATHLQDMRETAALFPAYCHPEMTSFLAQHATVRDEERYQGVRTWAEALLADFTAAAGNTSNPRSLQELAQRAERVIEAYAELKKVAVDAWPEHVNQLLGAGLVTDERGLAQGFGTLLRLIDKPVLRQETLQPISNDEVQVLNRPLPAKFQMEILRTPRLVISSSSEPGGAWTQPSDEVTLNFKQDGRPLSIHFGSYRASGKEMHAHIHQFP